VLTHAPWFAEQVGPRLPTTQLLNYAHAKANPEPPQTGRSIRIRTVIADVSNSVILQPSVTTFSPESGVATVVAPRRSLKLPIRLVVGSSNLEQFTRVGHYLFTMMAAVIGGLVARWFHRTGRSAPTPAAF
jgi:hypothetical protein